MTTTKTLGVTLKTTEPACVAFLTMSGPYAQIPDAFARLYAWIGDRGLVAAGAPSAVFLTDPAEGEAAARWELRAPLAGEQADAPADGSGCGIKHVAPHLVASATWRGPYERIAPAYEELATWILTSDYALEGPPEELYASPPATAAEEQLTEVRLPVGAS